MALLGNRGQSAPSLKVDSDLYFIFEKGAEMVKRISKVQRLRIIVAAAGIPFTTVAAIGDFLSPKGGWIIPLAFGTIASLIVIALLLWGTNAIQSASHEEPELDGFWEGPRHKQLGIWVLAIFAISSITIGLVSRSKSEVGGILSSHFSAVSDAQMQIGMLQGIEGNTRRTAVATEGIRDSVKKEVSNNPRKELANLGQAWTASGFSEAVHRQDAESVGLYLDGGMIPDNAINMILNGKLWGILDQFVKRDASDTRSSCHAALSLQTAYFPANGNNDTSTNFEIDSEAVRAYGILCGKYPELIQSMLLCSDKIYHEYRFCQKLKVNLERVIH